MNNLKDQTVSVNGPYKSQDAFMDACQKGQTNVVELLLRNYKPDLTVRTKEGNTCLHLAVLSNNAEMAKLLIEAGADTTAVTDDEGFTPLRLAIRHELPAVTALLLQYKPDVNSVCNKGATPLLNAIYNCDAELVRVLLQYGADATLAGEHGDTPLMAAVTFYAGHAQIVELLLQHLQQKYPITTPDEGVRAVGEGDWLNRADLDGKTALSIAQKNNLDDVVSLLRAAGAHDIKCANIGGKEGSCEKVLFADMHLPPLLSSTDKNTEKNRDSVVVSDVIHPVSSTHKKSTTSNSKNANIGTNTVFSDLMPPPTTTTHTTTHTSSDRSGAVFSDVHVSPPSTTTDKTPTRSTKSASDSVVFADMIVPQSTTTKDTISAKQSTTNTDSGVKKNIKPVVFSDMHVPPLSTTTDDRTASGSAGTTSTTTTDSTDKVVFSDMHVPPVPSTAKTKTNKHETGVDGSTTKVVFPDMVVPPLSTTTQTGDSAGTGSTSTGTGGKNSVVFSEMVVPPPLPTTPAASSDDEWVVVSDDGDTNSNVHGTSTEPSTSVVATHTTTVTNTDTIKHVADSPNTSNISGSDFTLNANLGANNASTNADAAPTAVLSVQKRKVAARHRRREELRAQRRNKRTKSGGGGSGSDGGSGGGSVGSIGSAGRSGDRKRGRNKGNRKQGNKNNMCNKVRVRCVHKTGKCYKHKSICGTKPKNTIAGDPDITTTSATTERSTVSSFTNYYEDKLCSTTIQYEERIAQLQAQIDVLQHSTSNTSTSGGSSGTQGGRTSGGSVVWDEEVHFTSSADSTCNVQGTVCSSQGAPRSDFDRIFLEAMSCLLLLVTIALVVFIRVRLMR